MDIEIDKERIVNQFKRNGHMLNKNSLEFVSEYLKNLHHPHRHLEELIKKMNQMVIVQQQDFNQQTLKLAVQLLNHKTQGGKSFSSYQKLIQHLRKWTIFNVNPYESNQRFFVDKPDPHLFEFNPKDYLQINKARFKTIRDNNIAKEKKSEFYTFLGVLFERFVGSKNKIMLQNQINEIQLVFPPEFQLQLFLIPGCTYIAHGELKSSDLQLTVRKLELPQPLPPTKQNLLRNKLKLVCDNISLSKSGLDFSVEDFRKFQILYNKQQNKAKPVLLFGNFKITQQEIGKVKNIIEKFTHKVQCVVLFITESGHEKLDLKKQLQDIPVYIVPHINSEGPRILPKIPILKNDYNAKVVTNPSRFSIHGRQCLFLNYPMVKNLYSKSLISKQNSSIKGQQIAAKVSNMLFSQNNIGITNKIFWKQSSYFDIYSDDIIFIYDNVCPQINLQAGKGGNFVSIGNFQNYGDFVFFLPHIKQSIQLSNNRE